MAERPDEPEDTGSGAPAPDQPGPPRDDAPQDEQERWEAIVRELGALGDLGASPPDTDPGPRPAVTYPVAPWVSQPHVVRPAVEPTGRDWDGTDQIDAAEAAVDDDEHFVPPDPGPLLGGDPLLTMAWFAAIGMPILLLVVLVAWRGAPAALVQAAVVVFVLGIGVLLWRMPNHRRTDDDADDTGAVV